MRPKKSFDFRFFLSADLMQNTFLIVNVVHYFARRKIPTVPQSKRPILCYLVYHTDLADTAQTVGQRSGQTHHIILQYNKADLY